MPDIDEALPRPRDETHDSIDRNTGTLTLEALERRAEIVANEALAELKRLEDRAPVEGDVEEAKDPDHSESW